MVSRSYMTQRDRPRSAAHREANLTLFPVAINALGAIEVAARGVAARTEARPAMALLCAASLGYLLHAMLISQQDSLTPTDPRHGRACRDHPRLSRGHS